MRLQLKVAVLLLAASLVVPVGGCLLVSSWARYGVVKRSPHLAEDLPTYGEELRNIPPYDDTISSAQLQEVNQPAFPPYSGPGYYLRWSANRSFLAVTTDWDEREHLLLPPPRPGSPLRSLLQLVTDSDFYHTINVWDERDRHLTPVTSVREADPGSGCSHRYAWSQDSEALLIYGKESSDNSVSELCLVYLTRRDELYRLARCRAQL